MSPVEGRLHSHVQVSLVKRFDHKTVGAARFDSPAGRIVVVSRQKDHRNSKLLVNEFRGLDTVHLAFEVDVHQHQVGSVRLDQIRSLFSLVRNGRNREPPVREKGAQVK